MTFLLAQVCFSDIERRVLSLLQQHAQESAAQFWDVTRARLPGDDLDVAIVNITVKGREHGLVPHLEAIRAQFA